MWWFNTLTGKGTNGIYWKESPVYRMPLQGCTQSDQGTYEINLQFIFLWGKDHLKQINYVINWV